VKHARSIAGTKHRPGGAAIIVAILGETKILLIRETTKPLPHCWKLVSETLGKDEPILDGLCRGVDEEAGLRLEVRLTNGKVFSVTDPRIIVVAELVPSHMVPSEVPHRLHFWGLLTTDEVVMSLSGRHLEGDTNEKIDTMAFNLSELEAMDDLLPPHRELIRSIQLLVA
jgi:ADP-ribose pyrophosphatase YjhB (NUDIX family)